MNLAELVARCDPDEVADRVMALYPGDPPQNRDGYYDVLGGLAAATPVASDDEMSIVIEWDPPSEWDDEGSFDVSGHKPGDPDRWGLGMTEWCEVLGMDVDEGSLFKVGQVDSLAHIIWEMTFYGWDEFAPAELREKAREAREWVENNPPAGRSKPNAETAP